MEWTLSLAVFGVLVALAALGISLYAGFFKSDKKETTVVATVTPEAKRTTEVVPVILGGTGATTVTGARTALSVPSVDEVQTMLSGQTIRGTVTLSMESGNYQGYVMPTGLTTGYELIQLTSELIGFGAVAQNTICLGPRAGKIRKLTVTAFEIPDITVKLQIATPVTATANITAEDTNLSVTIPTTTEKTIAVTADDVEWPVDANTLLAIHVQVSAIVTLHFAFSYEFVPSA